MIGIGQSAIGVDQGFFQAKLTRPGVAAIRLDPLPGTALYERVRPLVKREWSQGENIFGSHVLIYNSEFSEAKMWFGILKGHAQFLINHRSKASTYLSEAV
jgi:hypothetical protein